MPEQANGSNKKKNKRNPVIWFFFAIIIPIIVAATLIVVTLEVAGVGVIDWTKEKVMINSSKVSDSDSSDEENTRPNSIQSTIEAKDSEIEILNQDIQTLESTIDELEQEIVKLEKNQEGISETATETENGEQQADDSVKVVANAFKEMDGEQSAAILESLDRETAVTILLAVSNKVRGSILQDMDPKIAAELTKLLLETEN